MLYVQDVGEEEASPPHLEADGLVGLLVEDEAGDREGPGPDPRHIDRSRRLFDLSAFAAAPAHFFSRFQTCSTCPDPGFVLNSLGRSFPDGSKQILKESSSPNS